MPMVDNGDIVMCDASPRQRSPANGGATLEHRPPQCGAMIQQGDGQSLQSWPQQFVRLVGGHRRPPAPQG
jgi:hypothetical protein